MQEKRNLMIELTKENITESIRQIESIIRKIEAIDNDKLKKQQLTLTERRLVAMKISLQLLNAELEGIQ